jgi:hypothetical protein
VAATGRLVEEVVREVAGGDAGGFSRIILRLVHVTTMGTLILMYAGASTSSATSTHTWCS